MIYTRDIIQFNTTVCSIAAAVFQEKNILRRRKKVALYFRLPNFQIFILTKLPGTIMQKKEKFEVQKMVTKTQHFVHSNDGIACLLYIFLSFRKESSDKGNFILFFSRVV